MKKYRYFVGNGMYFSFALTQKKRYQKKKSRAEPPGLLRSRFLLKGKNSLRSDSLPFLTQKAGLRFTSLRLGPGLRMECI